MPLAQKRGGGHAMTDTHLWSSAELAEYLGVPPNTVAQWRFHHDGPQYLRIGKHVRYRKADVDRWLDEQAA